MTARAENALTATGFLVAMCGMLAVWLGVLPVAWASYVMLAGVAAMCAASASARHRRNTRGGTDCHCQTIQVRVDSDGTKKR